MVPRRRWHRKRPMGEDTTIDARMQAALARLTDNEKECLRRRLRQQTAKEMALDLGVSPHAVEKRLKMARTKLGLSSSLEAARLLEASEEYQQTGPQTSDLAAAAPRGDKRFHRTLTLGAITMSLLIATAIVLAVQGGVAPLEPGGDIVTWFYSPSGDLAGCPVLDAGIEPIAPDAGDGGDSGGALP